MDTIDKTFFNNYDYGIYFMNIIAALSAHGYNSNQNMYGAPYDFRKGPSRFPLSHFTCTQKLITDKFYFIHTINL